MNAIAKAVFPHVRAAIDVFLSLVSIPSGAVMWLYRRIGSRRLPLTTRILRRMGVFPIRDHYYEPLFNDKHLSDPLDAPRDLPGVDFNVSGQLELLEQLPYADEFEKFVDSEQASQAAAAFELDNIGFRAGDAEFLFQMIRRFKPNKLIEIGSGTSTKIARRALALNMAESGHKPRHICIEPYEQPWLETFDEIELIRSKVEDCNIDWRVELSSGDLLFIDSSHIIRPQGDVLHEYLHVIPQLQSGVIVHVHDIFSPRDYLDNWVRHDVLFWNEQYLLEATLGNKQRYEVLASLNLLKHDHYDALKQVCPYLERRSEPGSLYFRIRSSDRE